MIEAQNLQALANPDAWLELYLLYMHGVLPRMVCNSTPLLHNGCGKAGLEELGWVGVGESDARAWREICPTLIHSTLGSGADHH